ncbi:unnamed protein product, partial [Iphiclides podalirius]
MLPRNKVRNRVRSGQMATSQHAAHLPIDRVMMEALASVTHEPPRCRTMAAGGSMFPRGSRPLLHAPFSLLAYPVALVLRS